MSTAICTRSNTSSQHRPFQWTRDLFSGVPSSAQIEQHGHCSAAVVDVLYAKGKRVCYFHFCKRDSERRRRPILTNATASSSRPPNNSTTQQSSSTAQAQSQAAASTSTASPIVANAAPSTNPHVIINNAGRWTRFWLFICFTSSEYTDGQH
ncbi:hypothetical protein P692DRAFT_20877445 [Suillus brevipes Sb2]|nr:hypothetical protein P692DRAFT_20877445 [Suillus brevipes Sb2]